MQTVLVCVSQSQNFRVYSKVIQLNGRERKLMFICRPIDSEVCDTEINVHIHDTNTTILISDIKRFICNHGAYKTFN